MNKWTAVAVLAGGKRLTKRVKNMAQARRWWASIEDEGVSIKRKWLE